MARRFFSTSLSLSRSLTRHTKFPNPIPFPNLIKPIQSFHLTPPFFSSVSQIGDALSPTIQPPDEDNRSELLRSLEVLLGSSFRSDRLVYNQSPLVIVLSGPPGVGNDAVIKRLREVREGLHFAVTATTRPMRPGEVDGKDCYFISKEEFSAMMKRNELLEFSFMYGHYKGIPKTQIREFMEKGYDIVLRVEISRAKILRKILRNSAVFVFLMAESEAKLGERSIDRKTGTEESLLVRLPWVRENVKNFDYVVVNTDGKLESAVKLVESIIDAEKAKVRQRRTVV
ncbi:guanylate kinase 3, chloroplastic [Cucumis sativus]|uniref:Guanylate kinase-like domain-containing protein n=1 Tax=Cucumis sativus TaxID=3659 RepID=A0A0A0K367_CUCSA|nr:guanylate kinase 3, chloroplastic [Cucumis sativus]XP_011658900.1 guanylate kinase 3, chloroplastic [Cucumis sativus]XP_031744600.1 guanylate kinase 3, chloroplastic [Cucumis sativus]XP_031744601.1 guanylate kinase 3, chloroplastic [Cucumis sativus]KGN43928.1 hypothetical protein Csa_017095 [Cucumis sativus]